MNRPVFPTDAHQQIADETAAFFIAQPEVDTVLVVNSCARGVATADSDVDMAVLMSQTVTPLLIAQLESKWNLWRSDQKIFTNFQHSGRFCGLHLDIIDGRYAPEIWDDGGGPDGFELEIGNHIAYSALLTSAGPHFMQLQKNWLPYYKNSLRQSRYKMAYEACLYDLEHVPFYAERGLLFQAFDRLYKAHQEFLQALFIGKKVYPLAYNKWIEWQLAHLLKLHNLTEQLARTITVQKFDAEHLTTAAEWLKTLLKETDELLCNADVTLGLVT